jgi:hypothetical protein
MRFTSLWASYHKCEFLVTWSCQHLANANKFGHIRRVNSLLGLYVPVLNCQVKNHEPGT